MPKNQKLLIMNCAFVNLVDKTQSEVVCRNSNTDMQPGSGGVYGGVALHLRLIGRGESRWAGKHHVCMMLSGLPRLVGGLNLLHSSSAFLFFQGVSVGRKASCLA